MMSLPRCWEQHVGWMSWRGRLVSVEPLRNRTCCCLSSSPWSCSTDTTKVNYRTLDSFGVTVWSGTCLPCFSLGSLLSWLGWRAGAERWRFVCVSYKNGSQISACFFLSWLEDEYSSSSVFWWTHRTPITDDVYDILFWETSHSQFWDIWILWTAYNHCIWSINNNINPDHWEHSPCL